jgi:hypothetical protein
MLAEDLLEFVWNFRDAQVAEVRASVLCAVGSCLNMLPQDSILRLFLGSGSSPVSVDLPRYIHGAVSTDRDPQCRALAEQISSTICRAVAEVGL